MDTRFAEETNIGAHLIQNDMLAIAACDELHNCKIWTPMAEKIFGWKTADVLGKNILEVLPFLTDRCRDLSEIGVEWTQRRQKYIISATGEFGSVDVLCRPLFSAEGIMRGLLLIFENSSGRLLDLQMQNENYSVPQAEQYADELITSIGKAIERRRKYLSMSQEELASRCGLHRTYISDIERGRRNVAVKNLVRIAHALLTPAWVLVGWSEHQTAAQSNPQQPSAQAEAGETQDATSEDVPAASS